MKQKDFMKNAQSRGDSRFARVLTMLALLLTMSMGAQAKLAKVTFSGNNKSKTVYVGLPHAFWSNRNYESSNRYELDYIIAELWNKSASYSYGSWTTEGSDKVTCSSSSTPQYSVRIITISDVFDGEATVSGKYMTSSGQLDITLTITAEEVDNSGWATDITAGQYYIVDNESGKMMAAGHDWSTRGIVSDMGLDLTLTPDASSKTVTIDSRVSNGGDSHFLNILNDNELYMDSNAFGWGFVTNGTGYSIYDYTSGKYISIDANDNLVLSATPRQFNLVSKDDMMTQLKAKMATATATNPVDATMLITDPNFNRNDARSEAWEVVECTPWNYNPSGGDNLNNCAESYCSKFTIRQTISGAPAGKYQLTAQGFYRQDENKGQTVAAPMFFANGVNKDVLPLTGSENSMTDASVSFTAGKYTIDPIEFEVTEDGMMYIGITSATNSHWVIWDNFRLTYLGDPNAVQATYTATFTTDLPTWQKVYAYAWSGEGDAPTKFLGDWPGTELTATDGVYTVSISGETAPEKIIFNNGGSGEGNQTADLDFVNGKAYSYTQADIALVQAKAALQEAINKVKAYNIAALDEAIAAAQTAVDAEDATLTSIAAAGQALEATVKTYLTNVLTQAIPMAEKLNVDELAESINTAKAAIEKEDATIEELAGAMFGLLNSANPYARNLLEQTIEVATILGIETTTYQALLDKTEPAATTIELVSALITLAEAAMPAAQGVVNTLEAYMAAFDSEAAVALEGAFTQLKTDIEAKDIIAVKNDIQSLMVNGKPFLLNTVARLEGYAKIINDENITNDAAAMKAAVEAESFAGLFAAVKQFEADFFTVAPSFINKVKTATALYKAAGKTNGIEQLEAAIDAAELAFQAEDKTIVTVGMAVRNLILALKAYREANSTYTIAGTTNLTGTENDWDVVEANNMTLDAESGLYTWAAENITVTAETQPEFKVVITDIDGKSTWIPASDEEGNHDWIITSEVVGGEGAFNITITYNAQTQEIGVTGEKVVNPDTYNVTFASTVADGDKWTATPDKNVTKGETVTLNYTGKKKVKSITITKKEEAAPAATDLSTLNADYEAQDGETLTGTLDGSTQKFKISIADGATVTLDGVSINGVTDGAADAASSVVAWAGLTCEGNATIIVKDGTVNSVTGFHHYLPGIYVPANKTVTIKGGAAGTGVLNVQGSVSTDAAHGNRTAAAGIGAGASQACGNIVIEGGVINATGGYACAAIGGAFMTACGDITITGGTVTASGSASAAGIGGGWLSTSEDIVITGGTVNASSGDALNETDGGPGIGCGSLCSGGTITIGGTANVTAQGGVGSAGIGAGGTLNNNGSICSTITIGGSSIVEATGGEGGAGIGAGFGGAGTSRCGNILINGGTVTATAIQYAAGIGTGYGGLGNLTSRCGSITITSDVTKVTATKGNDEYSYCSIGVGIYYSEGGITMVPQSGTVTIGGVEYWKNNYFVGSGATYLTQSTLVYDPSAANN